MADIVEAIRRANSHLRYWLYRRRLNNDGPSLIASLGDWRRRFVFELRNNAWRKP